MFDRKPEVNPQIAKIIDDALQTSSDDLSLNTYISHGRRGVTFIAHYKGQEVCAKVYYRRLPLSFADPAEQEFYNACAANDDFPEIKDNLQTPVVVYTLPPFGKVLISELVKNHDGSVATSGSQSRKLPKLFIESLQQIVDLMVEKGVMYRLTRANTLIKWQDNQDAVPVLIDFQAYENYIHQPLLVVRHLLWGSKQEDMRKWGKRLIDNLTFPEEWSNDH